MDALGLVEPVFQCSGEFAVGQGGAGEGAGGPEVAHRDGAVAGEGPVAEQGDELEVLGHEDRDGDAVSLVDHDPVGEVLVLVAVGDSQVDALGVSFGDAGEEGDLVDAVAAPHAGGDEDFDVAGEAAEEFGLGGLEVGALVDLVEGLLLGGLSGGDVLGVGEGAVEVRFQECGGEHGRMVGERRPALRMKRDPPPDPSHSWEG